MAKEIVTLNYTLTFEIDEEIVHNNLKDAYNKGLVTIIKNDVSISAESGLVCDDKYILENTKDAIMYGLLEKGFTEG